MKKILLTAALFLITIPVLAGCGILTQKSVPSGAIIMADDFSVETGNWSTIVSSDHGMVGYQADGLRFVVNATNRDYVSLYKTPYDDVILDVDVEKLWGPDNNIMGIVCRYQDKDNYYGFMISSDGYYGIVAVVDGSTNFISDDYMSFDEEIVNTGNELNHLRAGCVESALWFEINGHNITGIFDDNLKIGKVGLIAGAIDETGVDVLFDNFSIIQP